MPAIVVSAGGVGAGGEAGPAVTELGQEAQIERVQAEGIGRRSGGSIARSRSATGRVVRVMPQV